MDRDRNEEVRKRAEIENELASRVSIDGLDMLRQWISSVWLERC